MDKGIGKNEHFISGKAIEKALAGADFGVWEWNVLTGEIVWSKSMEKIHGFEKGKFLGSLQDFIARIYPEDKGKFLKTLRNAVKENSSFKMVYRIIREDGQKRWISSSGSVTRGAKQFPLILIGTCIDITKQIEIEERLNAQYIISNELAEATSLKQISQKILKIIATTFGWEIGAFWLKREDERMTLEEIWPTEDKTATKLKKDKYNIAKPNSKTIEWFEDVFKKGTIKRKEIFKKASIKSSFVIPLETKGNTIGALEFYSFFNKPKDESTISILDSIKNNIGQVIEKQKIIEEHDLIRRQMQTIFQNVSFGITMEDGEGKILNANKAMAEVFDKKPEYKFVGKNIRTLMSKYRIVNVGSGEMDSDEKLAEKLLTGTRDFSETFAFINKKTNWKKYIIIKASKVQNTAKGETLIIKSFKDITEALDEQRRREFFVGVLSHELKNPLASIKAYSQLQKRRIDDKENRLYQYADSIESQTDRVANLVNDIFDMTKFTAGKFQLNKRLIDIDKTIEKTVFNFQPTSLDHKIIVKGKTNARAMLDEDRFVQALVNLLSNAVKYSPKGKNIEVIKKTNGKYFTVSVKDYGLGIPSKYQGELFKFFRVLPAGKLGDKQGIGMGLALARAIVTSHDGEMQLKSKPKEGSEFIMKFPLRKRIKRN